MNQLSAAFNPLDYAISGGSYGGATPTGVSGGNSNSSSQSQSSTQMIPGMMGVYSQLLGLNQQNYGDVMAAYQPAQSAINNVMPQQQAGYQSLIGGIGNTLGMGQALGQNGNWGIAQPAATAIGQAEQQQVANNTQQEVNSGLGNSTVGSNLNSQAATQEEQSLAGLGSNLAQTYAGYQAGEGNAALASQMQGLGIQAGLSQAQGSALAGYQFQNTAGALAGPVSNSSSQSASQQQSQQQQPTPQQQQPNQQQNPYGGSSSSSSPYSPGSPSGSSSYSTGFQDPLSSATQPGANYPANTPQMAATNYPAAGTPGTQASATYPPGSTQQQAQYPTNAGPQQPAGGYPPNAMSANPYSQQSQPQAGQVGYTLDAQGDTTSEGLQEQFPGINDNQVSMIQDSIDNPQNAPVVGYTAGMPGNKGLQYQGNSSWKLVQL